NKADAGDPDPQGSSVFDPNQIFEWDLAQRQPDRNEYQRYPGHPATTCLSPILGDTIYKNLNLAAIATTGTGLGYHALTGTGWAKFCEMINQFSPRVSGMDANATSFTSGSDYSSKAGNYRSGGSSLYSGSETTSIGSGTAITYDQDRLYATVDEYFFSGTMATTGTQRANNGAFMTGSIATGSTSTVSGTTLPVLPPTFLEKARFFLTANSNAPELNVFNMPRVSIWPITKTATTLDNPDTSNSQVTATMTTFDKVIAFDATVGGSSSALASKIPFYFSRYDPFSQTADYANSTNNQNLYAYLHNLMNQPFPGLSASANATFVRKYPAEDIGSANQILTEIYDYIRITNIADMSDDIMGSGSYGSKSYTFINPRYLFQDLPWYALTNIGQVTPIVIPPTAVSGTSGLNTTTYTRGMGRIIIPGEMTMLMMKEDERINSGGETATVTSIPVANGPYKGTWNLKSGSNVPNYANVLLKEPNGPGTVYQLPEPGSPPPQDYPLVPGPGGLSASNPGLTGTTSSGSNTYDPRSQTKLQIVLMPYEFCPMAGHPALGNNLRFHWNGLNLQFSGTDSTKRTAVTPLATSPYYSMSGSQGQDLYESGRIEAHNSMESHFGGPMGPKTFIDPQQSAVIPSNTGAPQDSMYQTLEVVVDGTNMSGAFNGSSPNTMQIQGTGTLQIVAPAIPMTWAARGINNDQPSIVQTIAF
ncbi:MAG TPA: hypothetical protein VHI52_20550, partial [Verrucomicrobiae bacterium]|nr:hypothetical protein [Verrucomicrobiae bacterium]